MCEQAFRRPGHKNCEELEVMNVCMLVRYYHLVESKSRQEWGSWLIFTKPKLKVCFWPQGSADGAQVWRPTLRGDVNTQYVDAIVEIRFWFTIWFFQNVSSLPLIQESHSLSSPTHCNQLKSTIRANVLFSSVGHSRNSTSSQFCRNWSLRPQNWRRVMCYEYILNCH